MSLPPRPLGAFRGLSLPLWTLLLSTLLAHVSAHAYAEEPAVILPLLKRPTVQERFAPRVRSLNIWAGGVAHIRDDYYTSYGAKADLSYFFNDTLGVSLGARHLWTSLSDEALILRDRYGLTPDARPQSWHVSLGALMGLGYAKALLSNAIAHVDPVVGLQLGLSSADERLIPTIELSALPTLLLAKGLKVRLELSATVQFEQRERGLVVSTGFLPSVSVGWGGTLNELSTRLGFKEKKNPSPPPEPLPQPTPARP